MKLFTSIVVVALVVFSAYYFFVNQEIPPSHNEPQNSSTTTPSKNIKDPEIIVSNLDIPWDIAFLPEGALLVTERVGNLLYIQSDGTQKNIAIPRAIEKGEGGLLGITLHPDFKNNNYIYLYMTVGKGSLGTRNAVIRYQFKDGNLKDEKIIIDDIPGAIYHDGGRIEFGPDGMLYVTTGDATSPQIAQDKRSLGGKTLRVTDDGSVPEGNPFETRVYSYGHRNSQGLAWDAAGNLWGTEHGRSGVTSGLDEVNLIVPGANYGWPTIEGSEAKDGMVVPAAHSGSSVTWAPASALHYEGSIFFGGLKGEALYEAVLDGKTVKEVRTHLKGEYGRIRTVRIGPDGMFYLTTSNTDGRGSPVPTDDRIIRIDPQMFRVN